jgi:hypothetical protein
MFVACPNCGFLVAAQPGTTQRCPRCGSPVDPRLAKPLAKADVPIAADTAESTTEVAVELAPAIETSDTVAAPAALEVAHRAASAAPTRPASPSPATAPARYARRTGAAGWSLACHGVVLFAQIVLAQREELAANARWRPLISGVCARLRCEVPAWREPTAFTMLQRSVQPKPAHAACCTSAPASATTRAGNSRGRRYC